MVLGFIAGFISLSRHMKELFMDLVRDSEEL
jgi:hypothetical protein